MGAQGEKFSVRRVRELLQRAGRGAKHAACKPWLTEKMTAARLEFAISHLHWTQADWAKVSFTDESTFRLVRGGTR